MPRHRRRIALLAIGTVVTALAAVPLDAAAAGTTLYRVNAGGDSITDSPSWQADTQASPSQYTNAAASASTTYSTTSSIDMSDSSVPSGTPMGLFQSERWDAAPAPEMSWNFPVTPGSYQVRLFFAEIYPGTMSVGARVFNVTIENAVVLNQFDVYAAVGGNKALVKTFTVTADSSLDIVFGHVTENPNIKAIEITQLSSQPNTLVSSQSSVAFPATAVGQTATQQIVLTNAGGAGDPSITVSSTTISGTNANQFSDNFNDATGATVAPGNSTSFTVSFAPTSSGTKSGSLSIAHTGTNTPITIPLSGLGGTITPVGFGKSTLTSGAVANPTSIQFGPDGRLYVGTFGGLIKAYTVVRNGTNAYSVTAAETISLINTVPNHDDNGAIDTLVTNRLITGILVKGTTTNPVIYVTHSDPRIGGGAAGTDTNLDTNSSMISRLTWNGSSWQKLDLVRGLPRSEENHAANGMQLDPATNKLYVAMGGNTNMGAPSNNFANLPEFALSAAILTVDLNAIGNTTYDLPTLDDDSRAGNPDAGDPFGGDNGKNQAKLVPGGPVQVYMSGLRNPYDVLIHSSGRIYTIDNGPNAGWGDIPINAGPAGNCTNAIHEPGITDTDGLHLVTPGAYGGHPNPTRGNMANTFDSPAQSPVSVANAVECDYRFNSTNGSITTFPGSTDGLTEYTASNFGGAMKGDLLAASWDNNVYRVKLDSAGTGLVSKTAIFPNVGQNALDVTTQPDTGQFPGTVWVADYGTGQIYVFEPNDFGGSGGGTCTGVYSNTLDEDHDGFTNADEIDNGTDPCSAASVPPDHDGDHISDLNDPDDDNDGIPDVSDPFAWDPSNGTSTYLPVSYTWNNGSPSPGGFLNLGFTGLMTNGSTDYLKLFDPAQMTAGGAAGVMTIDSVPPGDAIGTTNTQQYGFQFGLNANPSKTGKFTAHTRINAPFTGVTPAGFDSMGLFVGTGKQSDYVKIVTAANGGAGGIEAVKEVADSPTVFPQAPVALPGPKAVDLYLTVDPAAATIQPSYQVTSSTGSLGPITPLGAALSVPSIWFTGSGLAVGVISTSSGGTPFAATWDLIEATPGAAGASTTVAQDTYSRSVSSGWGSADVGGPWTIGPGTASNFSADTASGVVVAPAGIQQVATLGSTSVRDLDARASFTMPGVPSGTNTGYFGFLLLRKQTSGAYDRVGVFAAPNGMLEIRGQNDAGTTIFPDINTGLPVSPGDSFTIRVQTQGTSPTALRAKAWRVGSPEPLAWQVDTTTSSGPQTAGSVGIRIINTTSSSATIKADNLQVTSLAPASGQANMLGTSTSSIAFPSTAVGQSAGQQVTLTNLGAAGDPSITVNSTTISGTDAAQFSDNFNDATGVTLPPGASTTFTATFSPTSSGSKSASLSVAHTGSNTPLTIALSGTATQTTTTGSWQSLAPSAVNRQEVAYSYYNGKFYLTASKQSQRTEIYDPGTNAWGDVAPFPALIDHIQSVEVNGKIYYLGGLVTWPSPETNTVYIYNPATNIYTQGANMPRPRGAGGVAVYNGKIYYAGGLNQGVAVNWFDVYDPATNTWAQLPNMPHARDHFQGAVVNGKFWAIGGRLAAIDATVGYNEAYNFANGTWQTGLAPLPTLRGGFATAVLGNEVLIIGGEGGGQTFSTNEAYNTVTNTWRTLAPMPTARHGIEAAVCNGGVYITAGGLLQGGGAQTNVQQVFFLNGPTTCGGAPAPGTTIAQDSFGRTVSGGWGSAQTGGAWSILGGSASNFSVDGASGVVTTPGNTVEELAGLSATTIRDVDTSVKVTIGSVPTATGGYFAYLVLRRQSTGAYYRVGLMVTVAGTLQIRGQTSAGVSLFTDVNTGLTVAAGNSFMLRVQLQGASPTTIRARAWRAGTTEPTTWAVNTTNSTAGLQQAGSLGIRTINTTTGPAVTLKLDDLLAVAM